jgi:hypothetical protein
MSLLNEASFLVTPNGYKEDKLYAAIPTNGNGDMTVTRTGTATRVNEAGLVELVPYNLLLRSQEFDNAAWTKSASSIAPNEIVSPDGKMDADLLTASGASASYIYDGVTLTQDVTYTLSVFIKVNSFSAGQKIRFRDFAEAGTADFDVTTFGATNLAGTFSSSSTDAVGNGWYRLSATFTPTIATGSHNISFGFTNSSTTNSFYIWGAQLVKGSSALTYQKTVDRLDIPRIDYTGGGCPSILLEPLRTNIVLRSEDFYNASFIKNFSEVIPNNTTAPDGTLTADTLSGDGTSGLHYLAQAVSVTSGVAYTQSVFAKKGTNNFLQIIGTTTNSIYDSHSWANFDLESGILGDTGTSATATITDFGNGWYRCTMTATATATASGNGFLLCLITSATSGRAETNSLTTSVHIWGAQVEAGAYPTSYIPTTTGTGTRIADVINRNDIYTNNLITNEGGTWFVDLINNVVMSRDASNVGLFIGNSSNGVTGEVLAIRNNGENKRLTINKRIAGSQSQLHVTTTDHVKVAIKWDGAKAKVFENGAPVAISLGVYETDFTTKDMEFFSGTGADVSKYIKQMALFPTPLSNDQCIALTTL